MRRQRCKDMLRSIISDGKRHEVDRICLRLKMYSRGHIERCIGHLRKRGELSRSKRWDRGMRRYHRYVISKG